MRYLFDAIKSNLKCANNEICMNYLERTLECISKFTIEVCINDGIQCRIEITNPEYDCYNDTWCGTSFTAYRRNVIPILMEGENTHTNRKRTNTKEKREIKTQKA